MAGCLLAGITGLFLMVPEYPRTSQVVMFATVLATANALTNAMLPTLAGRAKVNQLELGRRVTSMAVVGLYAAALCATLVVAWQDAASTDGFVHHAAVNLAMCSAIPTLGVAAGWFVDRAAMRGEG